MPDNRKKFLSELKRLNATFEEDSAGFDRAITVDAPKGFRFQSSGSHCLVEPFSRGRINFKSDCYKNLVESMQDGLEPCNDPDCDFCQDF